MPSLINSYSIELAQAPRSAYVAFSDRVEDGVTTSTVLNKTYNLYVNQHIKRLLNDFSQLEDNWDDDDAIAPNKTVLDKAKLLTNTLERMGERIFHTAPGPNGEIMLDIRFNKTAKSMEIIFYMNRDVVVQFDESGQARQSSYEESQLPKLIDWLHS
jgi:hypothetical protein